MTTIENLRDIDLAERERKSKWALEREMTETEKSFFEEEIRSAEIDHATMAKEVEKYKETFIKKPILLIDATDKGTMGQEWVQHLDPNLRRLYIKIQTGRDYSDEELTTFDYRFFTAELFKYRFGFSPDETELFRVCSLAHGDQLPTDSSQFSLIIGTGGEINEYQTQPEYQAMRSQVRRFFLNMLQHDVPFSLTCATHQILGQLIEDQEGNHEQIVKELEETTATGEQRKVTESGIVTFNLTPETKQCYLMSEMPDHFDIMSNHGQYLNKIPPRATMLANNQVCNTQILGYHNHQGKLIGISFQAHPEISSAILALVNRHEQSELARVAGIDPATMELSPLRPTSSVRHHVFPKIFSLLD